MPTKRTQRKRPKRRRPKKTKRRRRSRRGGGPKPGLLPVLAATAVAAAATTAAVAAMRTREVPAAGTAAIADDVAIVLITIHGSIMPTTTTVPDAMTTVGDVEYLEGRPLLNRLEGITIYKMNAVSPGICNYAPGEEVVSYAQVLSSMFGYQCSPTSDDPFAIKKGTYGDMSFPSMYDATHGFYINARTLMHIYKELGHNRGDNAVPMESDADNDDDDDKDGYDKEQHPYKLYEMTQDTPIFNKGFSVTDVEREVREPYDWNITMFDTSGPRSLLQGLLQTSHATVEGGSRGNTYRTNTVDIVSHLHLIGKRRIIIVDMSCSVSPSPAGSASPELTRHDTAGRGALRNMKDIAHG
jgi:hypothetical protein